MVRTNYPQLCILSHSRNIFKRDIGDAILRTTDVTTKKFSFQKGLSPIITLNDVDSMVKAGSNKIKTLYLAISYDQLNRSILLEDCRRKVEREIIQMLSKCLKPLKISTEGDVLKSKATQNLVLTHGAPLSTNLFLVYIDDPDTYGTEQVNNKIVTNGIGNAKLTLTAHDVVIHAKRWESAQN